MKKEILLYSAIYSWTATSFIESINAANNADIKIRINSPGGVVTDGYGMIAKIQEHTGKKEFHIDGTAYSMGAFLPLFRAKSDKATCLNVSEFLIHRAAYYAWLENDKNFFTEDKKASLNNMNAVLRSAIESWCTAEDWQSVTGHSLDDVFSLEQRLDIVLTADQAKQLGFVNEVISITPEKKAEIEALSMQSATAAMAIISPKLSNNQNTSKMTIDQLQKDHPEIFAEVVQKGVDQERSRVNSIMAFVDLDPEAVKSAIEKGELLSPQKMAEIALGAVKNANAQKMKGVEIVKDLENAAAAAVDVKIDVNKVAGMTAQEANTAAFQDSVYAMIGLNKQ